MREWCWIGSYLRPQLHYTRLLFIPDCLNPIRYALLRYAYSYARYQEYTTSFIWTDAEIELLLEAVKVFSATCLLKEKIGKGWRQNTIRLKKVFVERYPRVEAGEEPTEDFPKARCLERVSKDRIAAKLKSIRKSYKKAVDLGQRSGGGRVVMTFYGLCNDIWAGGTINNEYTR